MSETTVEEKAKEEKNVPKLSELISAWWEKKDPILVAIISTLLSVVTILGCIIVSSAEAQMQDVSGVITEYPLTKERLRHLEDNVRDVKMEQRIQRDMLRETQQDVKTLLKRVR